VFVFITEQVSEHQDEARKILVITSMVHQEMVKMNISIKPMVLFPPSAFQNINLLRLEYIINY
jgi:hypothetical protein